MDTLVLSSSYEPMGKVSWERAMSLWVAGRVEIVEEYSDRFIRTVKKDLNMPAVVRWVGKVLRVFRKKAKFSKTNVYLRDKGKCQYCSVRVSKSHSTYDHVIPRSKGGRTTWTNIVIACRPCNQAKGDTLLARTKMRLLTKPIKPAHLVHTISDDTFTEDSPESWKFYLGR